MSRQKRALGLPVHRLLVHFPIAFWLAVIVTGLQEHTQPSLAGIDMRRAARHGVRTVSAWCAYTARITLAAFLPAPQAVTLLFLALDLAGCALLLQGVYSGTRQIYVQLEKD
ncbi:MAG: hypothetical protein ACLP7P_18875 [Rhodomicrobium sp.]